MSTLTNLSAARNGFWLPRARRRKALVTHAISTWRQGHPLLKADGNYE